VEKPDLSNLRNQRWRLNNLYYIADKDGKVVKFQMNAAQEKFLSEMHFFNIILKARQLGMSTFIAIYMLDIAVFVPNMACGLIADKLENAIGLFSGKIKFAYERLPAAIRQMTTVTKSNETEMVFSNGSTFKVGTSLRSSTMNYVWVSELGRIAAERPDIAREIRSGALNTVAAGNFIFVESTAAGQEGMFFDMVQRARSLANRGKALSRKSFKFHFFPWWQDKGYVTPANDVELEDEARKYFEKLEEEQKILLTPDQKAWWQETFNEQQEDMYREFPSHPDEAFQASLEGAYFAIQLAKLEKQGRVTNVPFDPKYEVETWWDLGHRDYTVIIFAQRTPTAIHIIDCYASCEKVLADYAIILRRKADDHGYRYSRHVLPHDARQTDISGPGTDRKSVAESLGIRPIVVAPKLDIATGIDKARNFLATCYFDEGKTDELFTHLSRYRKEWNDRLGVWSDKPRHDEASHYADAFRYGAVAPEPEDVGFDRPLQVRRFGAV
jgi:hypothetical protein